MKSNPAVDLPRLPRKRAIPDVLRGEQAWELERAARSFGPMIETLVLVYLYQALRKSEARLLEWRYLDTEGGWIRFVGKGGDDRQIPLHPKVRRSLAAWREECPHPQWVFPSPINGMRKPISETWIRNKVIEVGEAAGVKGLRPHTLRHTMATRMLSQGAHVKTVQSLLGHRSLSTTQIYLHALPEELRGAMDDLDYRDRTSGAPDEPEED